MKLSPNFVEILGNFSTINSGMVFKPGKIIRTMSQNKTILAQAEIEEEFQKEFGIYDLNRMLALISLNKTAPELEVENESLVFVGLNGKGRIRQRFTDVKLISAPADKNIAAQKWDVEFTLNHDVFKWIFNVSAILKCPHMVISGEPGEAMKINAIDIKGEIVDSAFVTLDTVADKRFKIVFKNEQIKVLPGKYEVKVAKVGISHFINCDRRLKYWIGIENSSSSFE